MNKIMLMAGLALVAQVSTATDRSWGKVNDSYDGVYTNTAHWTGGVLPGVGDNANLNANASYTVTFPEGVVTNLANVRAKALSGQTLVLDGTQGTFVTPTNPDGTYDYRNFRAEDNGGSDIWQTLKSNAAASGYKTDPVFEFTNWKMTSTAVSSTESKFSFDAGMFNFRDPCGFSYSFSAQFPSLICFNFGNPTGSPTRQRAEIVVQKGVTMRLPSLAIQGNAVSNVFKVIGGKHLAQYLQMPLNVNGWDIAQGDKTTTEFILDDGAELEVVKSVDIGGFAKATNKIEHVFVRNGSVLKVPSMSSSTGELYGEQYLCADGGTISTEGKYNQYFTSDKPESVTLDFRNGGRLDLKHTDGAGMFFGSKATDGNSPRKHSVSFDASALAISPTGKFVVYGADFALRNGSVFVNEGTFYHSGRAADETTMLVDHSTVTNLNDFVVGRQYDSHLILTNGSTLVLAEKTLGIGGTDSSVSGTRFGRLDIYDSDIIIDNDNKAVFQTSRLADNDSEVNLYSGSIRVANTVSQAASYFCSEIAYAGPGVFNVYGGAVTNVNVRFAVSGSSGDAREAKLGIYGGEFVVTASANDSTGLSVGGSSYGSKTRRARIILNGGKLVAANVNGGISAQCRGGTGYLAFEADGGTLSTMHDTSSFLTYFDEAKVGAKGLTIDSAGHTVSIAQSTWANKDGEEGRIVFTGEGVKTPTGDVSGVSYIVLAGGTTDLSKQTAVRNLVVTNGATLKLDPAKTLAATSLTLGDAKIELTSTLTLGDVKTILKLTEPMTEASLAKLARTVVAAGVPSGKSYDLEQVENGGAYDITITIREPKTDVITLASGTETKGDKISFKTADYLKAQVGTGATLTLSGQLESGTFVKDGEGLLKLTNADNLFVPGFLLQSGGVSVSDFAALGIGPNTGTLTVQNGVLEITGPAEGMDFTEKIAMTQQSTNDIFVIKNEVDVTMPVPVGTSKGEFVKRGAGTLTMTVEGAKNPFTGGRGKGKIDTNYNVWGGTLSSLVQLTFDETSGMVTSSGVPAFLVAEGELNIVGKGPGAAMQIKGIGCVGITTAIGSVQPGLVLDNVELKQDNCYPDVWFYLGGGAGSQGRSDDFAKEPYVILTNNATLSCSEFEVGHLMSGSDCKPRLEVDGSYLNAGNWFTPNAADDGTFQPTVKFSNGSRLGTRRIRVTRDVTVDFDSTEIANYEHGFAEPLSISPIAESSVYTATYNFRNGSRLYCRQIDTPKLNTASYHPLTVSFGDSEWCLTNTTEGAFDFPHPDKIRIVAEAGGLKLPVPEGATWTMNHEVVGEGGLVNNGKGTLKLDGTTVGYTGATRAEAGATIDLGGLPQSITLAGPGTFQNGTLAAGSAIAYSADGTDVPTVSNVAFGGIVRVDLGRTTDDPLTEPFETFTVLKYTGTAPDVSKLRLKGTGVKFVVGEFKAEGGVVTCTPKFSGSLLILR